MASNVPTYNLKAVIHETGLTPATLRAWERRYGILKPQRSPGGHRLYTHEEIEMLRWLVARQAEGLSISHAFELWSSRQEAGAPGGYTETAALPVLDGSAGTLDHLRASWLAACLSFDETAAEMALSQALAMSTPEVVCAELLQKGLAELGQSWYAGTASVQQEHFASALAMRRLNALFAVAPVPVRPERVLAACPPGETHDLALLILSFILRWRGWDVVYLGADVPLAHLDATLRSTAPQLVLLAAQTLPGAASLAELAQVVASVTVDGRVIPVAYGGGIFNSLPALIGHIPGHFLGHEMSSVPQAVENLLAARPVLPKPAPISAEQAAALAGFREKEALIVTAVQMALQNSGIDPRYMQEANINFTHSIAAALALGNIHFLDHSVAWLDGMMKNYGLPPEAAWGYYAAYRQAVQQHLGSQAAPILDWFGNLLKIT